MPFLETIEKPGDIKQLSIEELYILAQEIRERIVHVCSETGGHVAPSLGVVELTIALYYVFDAEHDKIVWDVGHQTYAQKLLTGRLKRFNTLRTYGGISGFPKRAESKYDVFDTGHSSTSLSAATGFAIARDMAGEAYHVIPVIGDGSLGAGIAFEALNHMGHLKKDVIVVLNDNERSIGESVGALSQYLTRIITTKTYNRFRDDLWKFLGRFPAYFRDRSRNLAKRLEEGFKGMYAPAVIFEELGFKYIGPLNGHKLGELIDTFTRAKDIKGPRLIHVVTKKGKGFHIAEKNPEVFHGIGPYCVQTGAAKKKTSSWTSVFGDAIVECAKENDRIVAISAGMCLGTGLQRFRDEIPERFFDVGITEQHAVTMAAALALQDFIPVCAIYSTFLQRAYDQIIHDVCLQKVPVVFAIDRAGLVGEDGPTHHGPFDLSYLRCIPNIVVSAPHNAVELRNLLKTAIEYRDGPFAIRYPRGACDDNNMVTPVSIDIGTWEVLEEGKQVLLLATGSMVAPTMEAARILKRSNIDPIIINCRFIKPMDESMLMKVAARVKTIVTIEENTVRGGFGSAVLEFCTGQRIPAPVHCIGLPDSFIEHGARSTLHEKCGLDGAGLAHKIKSFVKI
ncbi:1-deoxy-D-xylulose-5-phosphate synthase [candidate division WOR-3 bacterium]|nr:1-deoxy-D-xylulose-5-phosphate synthase [candidate division WOR-3 bacterium]